MIPKLMEEISHPYYVFYSELAIPEQVAMS